MSDQKKCSAPARKPSTFECIPLNNSTSQQRVAIANWLRSNRSLTTLQGRQELGICHPAARVMELRRSGMNIITNWRTDDDSTGKPHRVAEYILQPGVSEGGAA